MDAIDPQPRRVDAESLKAEIVDKLAYAIGKDPIVAMPHDWLAATILVVRDRAIDRWMDTPFSMAWGAAGSAKSISPSATPAKK